MKKITSLLSVAVLSFSLTGCHSGKEMYSEKFDTMQQCLNTMKSKFGSDLEIIKAKPNDISGFLSREKNLEFQCHIEKTDAQGAYVEGWYEQKENK